MKLILTADVSGLGAPGDIVEVKDGYGRNYLLPRGLAIVATRGAQKQIQVITRAQDTRRVRYLDHSKEIKTELEGLSVTLKATAAALGANGVLLIAEAPGDIYQVTAGHRGTFYKLPVQRDPRTAHAQAIFVLEEE